MRSEMNGEVKKDFLKIHLENSQKIPSRKGFF